MMIMLQHIFPGLWSLGMLIEYVMSQGLGTVVYIGSKQNGTPADWLFSPSLAPLLFDLINSSTYVL